ncbi:disease resistance-like protein DSC1 [Senna tora]|uniref:Disease resistance-like protein DSC1 n=1 Tax=Senna tora TaxID=362788 RepID=A0A834T1P0_9FABA|nr:disease resistance-like protein DSC1 [Senna tora]
MGHDCDIVEIKECGMCPTYSLEYENFIKQIGLDLEGDLQASSSETGVRCSYEMTMEDDASMSEGLEVDGEPKLMELVEVCRKWEALREMMSMMNQQNQHLVLSFIFFLLSSQSHVDRFGAFLVLFKQNHLRYKCISLVVVSSVTLN